MLPHGGGEEFGVATEDQPAVVGDVQPLVGVGRPGIGTVMTGDEVGAAGAGGGPETEGAVDVDPGTGIVGFGTELLSGVESAGVHVAGLQAENGSVGEFRQLRGHHAALVVDRHPEHPLPAQAQQAQSVEEADVNLLAHHHAQFRRPKESLGLDIPAAALQQRVPRGGERAEVRHGGAGDKPSTRSSRERQNVDQPLERDLFQGGSDRRTDHLPCILIPGGGQPVGSHGDGQRPAVDEAEKAPTGIDHGGGRAEVVEE